MYVVFIYTDILSLVYLHEHSIINERLAFSQRICVRYISASERIIICNSRLQIFRVNSELIILYLSLE